MRMNREIALSINLISMLTNSPQTSSELARQLGVSPIYVSKLANKLKRRGLITTTRGRRGGITKSRPIRLSELIQFNNGTDQTRASDIQRIMGSKLESIEI